MRQVLIGAGICFAAGANYAGLSSYGNESSESRSVIPTGGTLSSLRVRLASAPGAGDPVKSYTIALLVNGSPTLSVTVETAATTGLDAGSQAVSAGDLVQIKITPANTPANNFLCDYSLIFEGSTAGESIILGSGGATLNNAATEYAPLSGMLVAGPTGTEASVKQIIPTAGTIKNLYWALDADPGTSPDAYRLTLRKSGESTALTSTIVADNTTGNDADGAHAVSVAAGDDVNLMIEAVSTPSATPYAGWGCVFVSDVDGESLVLGCHSGTAANNGERFNYCSGVGNSWASGSMYMVANTFTAKKLFVELSGSPYANSTSADKYTVSLRIATTNSAVAAQVADEGTGNVVGNSGANTVDVADGDLISISSVPASTPTARAISWGFVCFIESLTNYSLAAGPGSFAETGTAATLKATRKLTVGSGSFSESGTAATLKVARKVGAAGGAYSVAGTAAGLRVIRKLSVGPGAYSEAGTAAALSLGRKIAALGGAFTLSGTAVGLRRNARISTGSGSFAVEGTAADLIYTQPNVLDALPGAFVIAGTPATLAYLRALRLSADNGAFLEAGTAAALKFGRKVGAEAGAYSIAGTAATLGAARLLSAGSGGYVLAMTPATLTLIELNNFILDAGSGTFLISGSTVYFPRPGSSKVCFIFQKRRDHFRI